jgi:hypothetical protein
MYTAENIRNPLRERSRSHVVKIACDDACRRVEAAAAATGNLRQVAPSAQLLRDAGLRGGLAKRAAISQFMLLDIPQPIVPTNRSTSAS